MRSQTTLYERTYPGKALLPENKPHVKIQDGSRLQYHVPPKPERKCSLWDYLPHKDISLELEIGSGTGRFIKERALKYPDRFFIGLDKRRDRILSTQKKLNQVKKKNWALVFEDARSFLEEGLPPLQVLHVYHPDPWPKLRQHKHRFFRAPEAKLWAQAVVSGGALRFSSDHKQYFEEIMAIVQSWNLFDLAFCFQKRHGKALSRFEEIFLDKNEPVYKAHFIKR